MEATEPNMPRFTGNSVFICITYPTCPLIARGILYGGRRATLTRGISLYSPDLPHVGPAESL